MEDVGLRVLRQLERGKEKAMRKQRKPVKWNGIYFESIAALQRYHKMQYASQLHEYIKTKKKFKGSKIEKITVEEYENAFKHSENRWGSEI